MQSWIEVARGVRVTGDGVAWLPADDAIVVADIHIGYELAAQRRGGWLPALASGASIGERIAAIATSLGVRRVVVAGDLRHSTRDVDDLERTELAAFASAIRQRHVLETVLGNHDAGDVGVKEILLGGTRVVHHPPAEVPDTLTVCGHLHPRVTVRDETGASARYSCALVSSSIIVLPAFSEWAGGQEASRLVRTLPAGDWRALPVHAGSIADLGLVFSRTVD